ncbi:alpha-(1,3)-fucosyltransferase C-like isoform X2 [Eriocheir sinensis]|uniref:alpha-(1,3)-fucosyltransferase C-like isoform X2 n=1 Tax=Eriocheir sinensis TaxID=95602 RepID=UPI0021C5D880|nr:alpha-(1,3)-fucosyltransferase C-like isoform X2 [Eriocheir sinensis]
MYSPLFTSTRVFAVVVLGGVLTALCLLYSSSTLLSIRGEYSLQPRVVESFRAPKPFDPYSQPPTTTPPPPPPPPPPQPSPAHDFAYIDPTLDAIKTEPNVFHDDYVNQTLVDGTKLKIILYWNDVYGVKHFGLGYGHKPFLDAGCRVNTCLTTGNRQRYPPDQLDALLWHYRANDKSLPKKRSPHTRYIFWLMESASYLYGSVIPFNGVFNWTFTYRRDSDIYNPYGRVYRRRTPLPTPPIPRDYAEGKTKMAAWFVSHCHTESDREALVKEMQKWMKVDIYGSCGNLQCDRSKNRECQEMLSRDYKFYLSFENSLCHDYITEKFFGILNLDILPVVWGAGPYEEIAPPHSYINARDFASPHALVDYLLYLDKNHTAYNEYFRWKPYFQQSYDWARKAKAFCDLCEKLHSDEPPKTVNLQKWFVEDSHCQTHRDSAIRNFIHQGKKRMDKNRILHRKSPLVAASNNRKYTRRAKRGQFCVEGSLDTLLVKELKS